MYSFFESTENSAPYGSPSPGKPPTTNISSFITSPVKLLKLYKIASSGPWFATANFVPSGDSFKYPLSSTLVDTFEIIGVESTPLESTK